MSDIHHQLRNDREALLLLYLARELPGADAAELERILSGDPSLRQDLERLQALHGEVMGQLAELDRRPLHMSEEISTRRVMREMRRVALELNTREPVQLEASTLRRWPTWIYPVGAVAAMIFLFLALWGFGVIDIQPHLAEQDRSRMPHYDDDYPIYRDQMAQDRLQRILLASFAVEESDHPAELEETEDPGALGTNG